MDLSFSACRGSWTGAIYHPEFETEDYVLDGIDLNALDGKGTDMAPLYKGGPIVRRVKDGVRFFRLRDSSNPQIIRRYGDNPSNYFWEAWNPTTHVTRLYGGEFHSKTAPPQMAKDGNGLLRGQASFSGKVTRNVIGQWGLTQEYDNQPARSGTNYRTIRRITADVPASPDFRRHAARRFDSPKLSTAKRLIKATNRVIEAAKRRFCSNGRSGINSAKTAMGAWDSCVVTSTG